MNHAGKMKSARRAAFAARKNKKEEKKFHLFKFLIPLFLFAFVFLFIKINTRVWNGKDKVSLVYKYGTGDIGVTVMDPGMSEITTLIIPGDTQVDVARNYGTFKIENVWQLGINEKIGGDLLAETVTKNFLFPVSLWISKPSGIDDGATLSILNFIFFPGNTNISFGDRLQMGIFEMKVSDLNRSEIDLGKSLFLEKKLLNDGQVGHILTGPISQRLTIYFTDNGIESENVKVNITDATGVPGVSEKLGEILQVIGGKVVSIDKKSSSEDMDCLISGQNLEAVKKMANLFSCKISGGKTSFDLDITIGSQFAKRF